jgi:hypothetical protein
MAPPPSYQETIQMTSGPITVTPPTVYFPEYVETSHVPTGNVLFPGQVRANPNNLIVFEEHRGNIKCYDAALNYDV